MAMQIQVSLESSFFFAYGADLSRGGIFIETEEVLQPGTPLELEFTLPSQPAGDQPIRARGVVAWASPAPPIYLSRRGIGMGIEFTEIEPSAKARITAFVREAGLSSSPTKSHALHGASTGVSGPPAVREVPPDLLAQKAG